MFLFFILIISLYFLIASNIAQIFISTAKLEIPTEITTKKAKAGIETSVEDKVSNCLI